MPRMAATAGMLALAIGSITFNTARYPIVWDMARPSKATGETAAVDASLPAEEPAERPVGVVVPLPPRVPEPASTVGDVCTASLCAIRPDAVGLDDAERRDPGLDCAALANPPEMAGSDAMADPSPEPASAGLPGTNSDTARSSLVPVFKADDGGFFNEEAARSGRNDGTVERLPPVEDSAVAATPVSLPVGSSIPIYPTTGW